jgi:hypothetical protein
MTDGAVYWLYRTAGTKLFHALGSLVAVGEGVGLGTGVGGWPTVKGWTTV